jgi:predicted ATPase
MDYIEIKGYKSIQSLHLDLAPINLLIGANGSGKSNFISFFDFLYQVYNETFNQYVALNGGENKFLYRGKKITSAIEFKVSFQNGVYGYSAILKAGTEGFVILQELLSSNTGKTTTVGSNKPVRFPKERPLFGFDLITPHLNNLRKYHFHDTSSSTPFAQLSHTENDIYNLYEDGRNIAAFLFDIQTKNKIVYNQIVKNIQSIAPYFSDFYLKPNDNQFVRLQWTDKYSSTIYGAKDLSDGTLRFIALTVLFLQPQLPYTIIIDEPELGLHPTAIAKLAGMIQSAAAKGSQVIVATQSTDLISHFLPEDIVTVDQINGESVFKRLSSETLKNWLDDYTIDDLWKRNVIDSGQPNFS